MSVFLLVLGDWDFQSDIFPVIVVPVLLLFVVCIYLLVNPDSSLETGFTFLVATEIFSVLNPGRGKPLNFTFALGMASVLPVHLSLV
jgi:hypothetical protein